MLVYIDGTFKSSANTMPAIKILLPCLAICLIQACHKPNEIKSMDDTNPPVEPLTPTAVVSASQPEEWRAVDQDQTLYMQLPTGQVVIELSPEMAPLHVNNTKALVRQGVFDGSQFYRVLDGFVAQGGPLFEPSQEPVELTSGAYNIQAEFTTQQDLTGSYIAFDEHDGYADETGFVNSMAVGRDLQTGESWMLHCYGALAMGRSNDLNSGGVALYIVNGPAQRYLDRNTTVFGRVLVGMQHVQALTRSAGIHGNQDLTGLNTIESIVVGSDLDQTQQLPLEVLDSNSAAFRQLLQARKNRSGDWFVYQHNYMDTCGVPIPVRLKSAASP